MIETRHLRNGVIFFQTNLSFVSLRKTKYSNNIFLNLFLGRIYFTSNDGF